MSHSDLHTILHVASETPSTHVYIEKPHCRLPHGTQVPPLQFWLL